MSALAMTIAWQLYRAKYGVMPFHARAFGICLSEAYHSLKGGKFATIDHTPRHLREAKVGYLYAPTLHYH